MSDIAEPKRPLTVRYSKNMIDSIQSLIDETHIFSMPTEFVLFSVREMYLRLSSEAAKNGIDSLKSYRIRMNEEKALFENGSKSDVSSQVKIDQGFYNKLSIMCALIGVTIQCFIKSSIVENLDNIRSSAIDLIKH